MMTKYTIDIGDIDIDLNPYKLGESFAEMNSLEQMRFLNGFVTSINEKWPFQCRSIQEEYESSNNKIIKRKVINALTDLTEHLAEETLMVTF